ncbi:hypothetical protein AgCh_016306 [Apium graveolens]
MTVLEYEKKFTELLRDRVAMFELDTYAGVVQKAALIESNGMQSRKEKDNKKRKVPFYGEKYEAGSSQERSVKRIRFHKGENFQKKGNLNKRQESKGNNQESQGQVGENRFQRSKCKHHGKRHPGVCNKLNMTCYRCNQKGHLADECKIPKSGVTCYKCGKTGHIARECKSTGPVKALMNVASTSASLPVDVLALPPPPTTTPQETARTFDLKMKDAVQNFEGNSCISGEESSRISLGMCSPLREERNGQITAKKRSKLGIFPVGSCAPAQQC